MERKLLTKRGKALYKMRSQMKGTQEADEFRVRGQELCDGEWKFHSAHTISKNGTLGASSWVKKGLSGSIEGGIPAFLMTKPGWRSR